MTSENLNETLFDRQDLMKRWNCSIASIKRYEASGHLKSIRIGPRLVRYRMADILAFEETQGVKAEC